MMQCFKNLRIHQLYSSSAKAIDESMCKLFEHMSLDEGILFNQQASCACCSPGVSRALVINVDADSDVDNVQLLPLHQSCAQDAGMVL